LAIPFVWSLLFDFWLVVNSIKSALACIVVPLILSVWNQFLLISTDLNFPSLTSGFSQSHYWLFLLVDFITVPSFGILLVWFFPSSLFLTLWLGSWGIWVSLFWLFDVWLSF
jgi:hypothetical protein